MQSARPQTFTIQGKGQQGGQGPVPRRCLINACCRRKLGMPGIGLLQAPTPGNEVGGENPEQRLSDNKARGELSEGREVDIDMAYLPSQPGSSERGGAQGTPRGCRRQQHLPTPP